MTGFGANAGEFASAAGNIRGAADPIRDDHSKKIKDLGMGAKDFGKAHGDHFTGYQDAMNKLSACATSLANAMDDFAGKLEQTGAGYDWSDAEAADTVGQSGGN
ncbi:MULTISPECIES: WXG100 family type VII secretion target [Saccharopolyspora]|uniref:WXG100 family type VII secretion target n=1 Tax=Saccharopolyspora cebuensis TaxID=418759 RepID=A0ABV4CJW4_9PSEU